MEITRREVERLGALRSDEWPIVSLYLRVAKEHITDDHYSIHLKNLLRDVARAKEQLGLTRAQSQAVDEDVERIREFFRDHGDEFGQGVALFASSRAGLWQVYHVPREIGNEADVDFRPVIGRLVRVVELFEPVCTCLISRDRARIFAGHLTTFREVAVRLDEEVPGQHGQGGWSQARFARHIEDHVRQHFERVGQVLFHLFEQDPFRFLVVGGPDEVVADFVDGLHPYLRERYVGAFNCLMEANVKQVHEETRRIVEAWQRQEKRGYVELMLGEALSQDMAVLGLERVVEVVQMQNVNALVVDDRLSVPGRYCLRCGAVQPIGNEANECTFCSGPVRARDNIVPEVYAEAYRQNANLVFLNDPEFRRQLEPHGGIGAILRYRIGAPTSA
ncbi:MAG: Vms1/Ankzf1 family peptidyl-tRNA hydrolase [Thermomicrobium sp.]|nr:Vms1/Ankzf1 family peptidyl-tRNA hydrolase [Thermomicrobium sp.]MDW8060047.1 Vms1/Ankzf1 family peptidyl-tRNA hydrolase [Thermomicrobium sp.]